MKKRINNKLMKLNIQNEMGFPNLKYGSINNVEYTDIEQNSYIHDNDIIASPSIINNYYDNIFQERISIIFYTLNALFGVALFAMPWGFQQSGIIGGSIILITISILSYETVRILLVSQKYYYEETGHIKTYPEIASTTLGLNFYYIIQITTIISCLGGCTGYIIFFGQTLGQALSISSEKVILLATIPIIILSWIRSFQQLSLITMFGIIALVLSILILLYDGSKQNINIATTPLISSTILNFIGPATFLFTIHYCILSIGAEILKNKQFSILHNDPDDVNEDLNNSFINSIFINLSNSIAISYVIASVIICTVGAFGYIMYRNVNIVRDVDGNIVSGCECIVCQNIILNISPGFMRNMVGITMSMAILFSYLVILAPAREHIEEILLCLLPNLNGFCIEIFRNIVRTFLVLLNVGIAIKAPYFGGMLGAVGGITDAFLCFVVPPLVYYSIFKNELNFISRIFYHLVMIIGIGIISHTVYNLIL